MALVSTRLTVSDEAISATLRKYWGYDQLRPLQKEAIEAGIEQRDSLVVLPTGGGKSLCYQVPPLVANRTDIVVSPLISLMKDQVDALKACGYPAVALHSGLSEAERRQIGGEIASGKCRLVFVAPERLLTPWFLSLIERLNVRAFAIDEAHCISQWGHDFRPEYRRLAVLKERFPQASVHAFTATATPRVRQDIVDQLGLKDPKLLVGRFDRPNLVYRVIPRVDLDDQVLDAVRRHASEAVIVYCISRNDTERMAVLLKKQGVRAAAYHAGLDALARAKTQDDFAAERLDVVVATVAFGMGIDRSNVRCVIHAAMPKSVEHYQQETGRAGRDGLEAECVLFYSPADFQRWEWLLTRSSSESGQPGAVAAAQIELLREMQRICMSAECRHRALSRYFGQAYEPASCKACDVCLTEGSHLENAAEIARQVVACVDGLGMPFGVGYVVEVLCGSKSARIERRRHHLLPQYGALKSLSKDVLQSAVFQLVEQGLLDRTAGERPVLQLTPASGDVLAGRLEVKLRAPAAALRQAAPEDAGWQEVDRGLFERLREIRRTIAAERAVPPFVIFSDATLRELARLRPASLASFGQVKGIGERKLADLGGRFVAAIAAYCKEHGLVTGARPPLPAKAARFSGPSAPKTQAFELFDQGKSLDDVAVETGRARATVVAYLEDYVAERGPESVATWINPNVYRRVEAAAKAVGGSGLRPVFEALGGEISYDDIRIVMRHLGRR